MRRMGRRKEYGAEGRVCTEELGMFGELTVLQPDRAWRAWTGGWRGRQRLTPQRKKCGCGLSAVGSH